MLVFTHLLVEADAQSDPRVKMYEWTHDVIYFATGYNGIELDRSFKLVPVPNIKYTPRVFLLKRRQDL